VVLSLAKKKSLLPKKRLKGAGANTSNEENPIQIDAVTKKVSLIKKSTADNNNQTKLQFPMYMSPRAEEVPITRRRAIYWSQNYCN